MRREYAISVLLLFLFLIFGFSHKFTSYVSPQKYWDILSQYDFDAVSPWGWFLGTGCII